MGSSLAFYKVRFPQLTKEKTSTSYTVLPFFHLIAKKLTEIIIALKYSLLPKKKHL